MSHRELIDRLDVIDDHLHWGRRSLTEIAAEVGATPFYAYDGRRVRDRIAALRAAFPAGVAIHYAVKANPYPPLLALLADLIDGFDVASAGELRLALDHGARAEDVSFAGPGKRDSEIEAALEAGVLLNVESRREVERVHAIAGRIGRTPRIALRVNPSFELKGSGLRMAGRASQFGIDAEQVPELLSECARLGLDVEGFHVFSGSQCLSADAIAEGLGLTFELVRTLAADAPAPPRTLIVGGGFGIPYFPGDGELALPAVGAALSAHIERLGRELPELRVAIELGRYLVGEAGVFVTRVIDRKRSRGRLFLVTDGGMNNHLAASGNLGQVIRRNFPVLNPDRVRGDPRETASIVGPLCTPIDVLGDQIEIGAAAIGDLVAVLQSGAYGLSASPVAFLGHPPPSEILV